MQLQSPIAPREGLVSIEGLTKTFVSEEHTYTAIERVDLRIDPDDFFCLLGPSGCGKTTVLNVLAGFDKVSGGSVLFGGKEVDGPSQERAVVFQADNSLYDWLTAKQNVEFGLRLQGVDQAERSRIADEFLALVGLAGQGHKLPRELSGGMRQRVQIARVLANKPRMLLMDEPFAALDAQTRRVLQNELRRIWTQHRVGVLFITHDIEEAVLLSTKIGIMTAGPNARIKEIIEVPADLKRDRVDMEFVRLYGRIQEAIAEETNSALAMADKPIMSSSSTAALGAREQYRSAKKRSQIEGTLISALSMLGFFALWHLGSLWFDSVLFPSPLQFMQTFVRLVADGTLLHEASVSLKRILAGFILGCLIAVPLGLLIGSFRVMRLILEPFVELLRFIPSIAMITVAVIFFGIGEGSRVFLIAWVTVFTVTINTAAGVMSIEPNKLRAAAALGASRVQTFFMVTLPAATGFILVGARIAMANAFTTIVAAEIIGASSGLGTMLWQARLYMLVDNIYVVLISLSLLGITIDRMFRWLTRRFGGRYAPNF